MKKVEIVGFAPMRRVIVGFALYPLAVASLIPSVAQAEVCPGVRQVSSAGDPALLAVLSAQVGDPVAMTGFLEQGAWRIYQVTLHGDTGYVFFKGPARKAPKAFVWGGSGPSEEFADDLTYIRQKAPGIPSSLARCFARRVTGPRR